MEAPSGRAVEAGLHCPPREGLGYKGTEVVGDYGRIWGCSRGVGGVAET